MQQRIHENFVYFADLNYTQIRCIMTVSDERRNQGSQPDIARKGTKSGGKARRDDGDRSDSNYPTKPPGASFLQQTDEP